MLLTYRDILRFFISAIICEIAFDDNKKHCLVGLRVSETKRGRWKSFKVTAQIQKIR